MGATQKVDQIPLETIITDHEKEREIDETALGHEKRIREMDQTVCNHMRKVKKRK